MNRMEQTTTQPRSSRYIWTVEDLEQSVEKTHEGAIHAWDTRGRGHQDRSPEERRAAALKNFKPFNKAKEAISNESEERIAKLVKGTRTPDNDPLDIIVSTGGKPKFALEVKTLVDSDVEPRVNMRPLCKAAKEAALDKLGIKGYVVLIDQRGRSSISEKVKEKIWVKQGMGAYRAGTMTQVKSLKDLKTILYSGKA